MKPAPDRRLSSLKLKHGLWVTFPLCRSEGQSLAPPALFFFFFAAATFSAASPQNLPPQGRRISIWREHGVVRAPRAAAQSCAASRAQNCSAATQKHDVQWLWDKLGGLHTTEINVVLRVAHNVRLCARIAALCASRCSGKFVMKSFYIDLLLSQPAHPIIWEWPVC